MDQIRSEAYPSPSSPTTTAIKHDPAYTIRSQRKVVLGPVVIKEDKEQVTKVRENMKIALTRLKSYTGRKRQDLNFKVNGYVYLELEVSYRWYHPSEAP